MASFGQFANRAPERASSLHREIPRNVEGNLDLPQVQAFEARFDPLIRLLEVSEGAITHQAPEEMACRPDSGQH
jgi:hypothetical protein